MTWQAELTMRDGSTSLMKGLTFTQATRVAAMKGHASLPDVRSIVILAIWS